MFFQRRKRTVQPAPLSAPRRRIDVPGSLVGIGYSVPFGGSISPSTSQLTEGSGVAGYALINDGATFNGSIATASPAISTSTFSIFAVVEFASSGVIQSFVDRDINTLRSFQFRRTASSTIELIRFNTAVSSVVSATTVGTVGIGVPTAIICVVQGLNHAIYLGNEVATAAITGTPQTFDGVLGLCATWGGTSGTSGYPANGKLNGKLYAYGVLPYALSRTEARAMAQSPAALYSRIFGHRHIGVPLVAGGGATNLVVADALHGHAADNLVLTSEHLLTVADALHAHAADNVVLTSATALTLADALHAHAADNVVLTSATALTLADALHAHAADNVVLTSAAALTLADALHAHAADNVVLTSATALTLADALHAHAADNVVLEVAGSTNLVVQDALHDHLADVLALTSAHLLIVADATHGHTVDGLTLTVASVLALQDALHAHAADNLTLDAGNGTNLLLADALHAHTADGVALTVDAWLVVADGLHAHAADNVILTIPGAFREGNPRAWIVNARQRFVQLAARTRVAHLN